MDNENTYTALNERDLIRDNMQYVTMGNSPYIRRNRRSLAERAGTDLRRFPRIEKIGYFQSLNHRNDWDNHIRNSMSTIINPYNYMNIGDPVREMR